MPRIASSFNRRRVLAMAIDVVIVLGAYYLALVFRFAAQVPADLAFHSRRFLLFAGLAVTLHLLANRLASVYAIVNRYIGLVQALRLAQASAVSTLLLMPTAVLWPGDQNLLPLSVVAVGGVLAMVAMIGVRFYGRIFHERSLSNVGGARRRLLLVGAGQAADMLIREVQRNPSLGVRIVGLVDDDPALRGMRLHQHPVLGTVADAPALVRKYEVDELLIAIPSATPAQMSRIHRLLKPAGVPIKTLPRLAELVGGEARLADVRALDIQDLLGRPKVETDLGAIGAYLAGRRVLVTGAGGSIGSELSRQIAAFAPARLVLVDRDESALYHLHQDLQSRGAQHYEVVPTDILQQAKLEKLFAACRPHVVFHAAAFKHVPLMELHPDEAVVNNVAGTFTVAELAGEHRVERFVNISTDKAVDPVNVMGASKRVGEHLLRLLSRRYPQTRFCSVRFGNVLGSRGSVIPIFQQQIAAGGPVTVTHPEMTRYFMLIEEAVQLVLQAAAMVEDVPGGYGAFVLEMGEPVRIVELAQQMIDLLGNGPAQPIAVEFTGLRPGEKLHETLFCRGECAEPTRHPLVYLACLEETAGAAAAGEHPAGHGPQAVGSTAAGLGDENGLPPGFAEHLTALL
ncbi:MAG: polysaccharide biosynthesis protein, partial [Actinobacteria bacterium]|nr:polysaccharide biosynthesis protein [Actinomycetota bacterium]